jgi:murein DD-endopeptidase MepM/ murein hydrolase activator NlpD
VCIERRNDIPIEGRKVISADKYSVCPVGYEKLYPLLGLKNGHTGLDLWTRSSDIRAAHDGVVTEMSTEAARGLGVGITSDEYFDFGEKYGVSRVKTRYWHFKSLSVKVGQKVTTGTLLGISDSTGFSSGDHCHFECVPVLTNSSGELYNVYQDNGFFGKIDPSPYWNRYYAKDAQTIFSVLNQQISILTKIVELYKLMLKT